MGIADWFMHYMEWFVLNDQNFVANILGARSDRNFCVRYVVMTKGEGLRAQTWRIGPDRSDLI